MRLLTGMKTSSEFGVLKRGELQEVGDSLLSPCIPTIEDSSGMSFAMSLHKNPDPG